MGDPFRKADFWRFCRRATIVLHPRRYDYVQNKLKINNKKGEVKGELPEDSKTFYTQIFDIEKAAFWAAF